MQIMIFNNQFHAKILQQRRRRRRDVGVNAKATVTVGFGENDVFVTDPPVVEAHGEVEEVFEDGPGGEGDEGDFEQFLLMVGVGGEEGIGVFGEVVGAVVLPERINFVAGAVVEVEESVEYDAVEAQFDDEPGAELESGGISLEGEEDCQHGSDGGGQLQRCECLGYTDIRHLVASVLVAVQIAVLVTEP